MHVAVGDDADAIAGAERIGGEVERQHREQVREGGAGDLQRPGRRLAAGEPIRFDDFPRGAQPGEVDPAVVRNLGLVFIPVLVGMLFVTSPTTEAVFNPIFTALNAMPRIALAPLFIIWFGLGLGSKVAVGLSLTFFIVLTSTVAGGRGVNPDHITLARTLGASESQIFRKFVLPSAVPVSSRATSSATSPRGTWRYYGEL